jgi:ketosteroid isomerase-like protein
MSQENVEVARATFEAWNAGDMGAFRELFHPDVIMRPPDGWPESGPFVGREAVIREWEQARAHWDGDTLEPVGDFLDIADRVLVRLRWRGIREGLETNMEWTWFGTVRKGRVCGLEFYWDHAEALEAVGLRE